MVTFSEPVSTEVRQTILDAIASGQTRYGELVGSVDVPEKELDQQLIALAKNGKLSLVAVGDVLSVRRSRD